MEAATPLHRDSVRSHGDRVLIERLEVRDETVARLVREREEAGSDPVELVRDAVEIGGRVLDRESAAANTDFVRAEFEKTARDIEDRFEVRAREVDELLEDRLTAIFDADSGVLAKEFARAFSDESKGSVQNRTRVAIEAALKVAQDQMTGAFFKSDETNPLHDLKQSTTGALERMEKRAEVSLKAVHAELSDVKAQLEGLRAEREGELELEAERERGTAKGRTYEQGIGELLGGLAAPRGDEWEPVGDEHGAGGKKGDHLIRIGAGTGSARGCVVYETKDRRLSRPEAIKELDAAMAQRSADYAVLVVPTEDELPSGIIQLVEFGGGDKVAVVCDPDDDPVLAEVALGLAYAHASARVTLRREGVDGVDAEAIAEARQRALDCLDSARKIKSTLTSSQTGVDKAKDLVDEMVARVRAELDKIELLLSVD